MHASSNINLGEKPGLERRRYQSNPLRANTRNFKAYFGPGTLLCPARGGQKLRGFNGDGSIA
jgi:hypothetical protein